MTTPLDQLLAIAASPSGTEAQRQLVPLRSASRALAAPTTLPDLTLGHARTCTAMQTQIEKVSAVMAGSRHKSVLGPLMQLVRLHDAGHQGLGRALTSLRQQFIDAAGPGRVGGAEEAAAEFDRALAGAWARVRPAEVVHRVCEHWLDDYAAHLAQADGFARGTGGVAQRLVLHELLSLARANRSRLVRVDQGTLAVRTNKSQPKISLLLKGLRELGYLRAAVKHGPNKATTMELMLPAERVPVSVPTPAVAEGPGGCTDTGTRATWGHALFQTTGLGPGVGETYRALPLAQVDGCGSGAGPVRPLGLTPREVADAQGKHPGTIRNHLKSLRAVGVVVEHNGRWLALDVDLDKVAADQGARDGRAKRAQHQADRRARYYAEQALWEGEVGNSAFRLVEAGDQVVVVRASTGEVVTAVTDDWTLRRMELARSERESSGDGRPSTPWSSRSHPPKPLRLQRSSWLRHVERAVEAQRAARAVPGSRGAAPVPQVGRGPLVDHR